MDLLLIFLFFIALIIASVGFSIAYSFFRYKEFKISLFGYNPFKFSSGLLNNLHLPLFKKKDFEKEDKDIKDELFDYGAKDGSLNGNKIVIGTKSTEGEGGGSSETIPKKPKLKKTLSESTEEKQKKPKLPKTKEDFDEKKSDEKKKDDISGLLKKGQIRFTSLQEVFDKIDNNEVTQILKYLENNNFALIQKLILNQIFNSLKEFLDFLKKELSLFLKDELENIKVKISEFRKDGLDVEDLSIKAMSVPLKIKLFESSFSMKDFRNVFDLIELLDTRVKKLEESQKPVTPPSNPFDKKTT